MVVRGRGRKRKAECCRDEIFDAFEFVEIVCVDVCFVSHPILSVHQIPFRGTFIDSGVSFIADGEGQPFMEGLSEIGMEFVVFEEVVEEEENGIQMVVETMGAGRKDMHSLELHNHIQYIQEMWITRRIKSSSWFTISLG